MYFRYFIWVLAFLTASLSLLRASFVRLARLWTVGYTRLRSRIDYFNTVRACEATYSNAFSDRHLRPLNFLRCQPYRVWNSLPDFIRDPAISTDCFRPVLKRICSLDISAPSAFGPFRGLLDDNVLYSLNYLLTDLFLTLSKHCQSTEGKIW